MAPMTGFRRIQPLVLLVAIGCAQTPDGSKTPLPTPADARAAMEAALECWKAGKPTGRREPTTPPVQIMDSFRKPGQTVEGWEILGQTTGERAVAMTVRVRLSQPEATETIRFLLLGTDPVLVFRQEDYDLISHFEHKMDPEPAEGSP
jgi:hypothetical protein